jgi:hypothetical protein
MMSSPAGSLSIAFRLKRAMISNAFAPEITVSFHVGVNVPLGALLLPLLF